MSKLDFLKNKTSVYYSGLDYRAFPWNDMQTRLNFDKKTHLVYLKVLALLVDHVAIPPTFLVYGMKANDKDEQFLRSVSEMFDSKTFLTAVHSSMNNPKDFFEYKLNQGDVDEKTIFATRKNESQNFFKKIPLLHRDINSMSSNFKDLLIENINKISDRTLEEEKQERIFREIQNTEKVGEVSLSRSAFINILDNTKIDLTKNQYRACYYAMNNAYYTSGAQTYYSDIACLSVEEYSVLGKDIFEAENNKVIIGYDPILFFNVLKCHNISFEEIENLTQNEIDRLKEDNRFKHFIIQYRKYIDLLQQVELAVSGWSKEKIRKFKLDVITDIENRFHTEQLKLTKWAIREDIGSGFLTTILGGVLGLLVAGPVGAGIGAGIGFLGPVSKIFKFSGSEIIASKIAKKEFTFFLYIEYLKEKIEKLNAKKHE